MFSLLKYNWNLPSTRRILGGLGFVSAKGNRTGKFHFACQKRLAQELFNTLMELAATHYLYFGSTWKQGLSCLLGAPIASWTVVPCAARQTIAGQIYRIELGAV
jgi:hypothetical protein